MLSRYYSHFSSQDVLSSRRTGVTEHLLHTCPGYLLKSGTLNYPETKVKAVQAATEAGSVLQTAYWL